VPAAVALLYLFAARLYDERTARASGAFMLTAVTFWTYGGVAYPYTLLAALSIGCAMLYLAGAARGEWSRVAHAARDGRLRHRDRVSPPISPSSLLRYG
jgi:4-amino-4-deoxy-L-arabinose transferase-like glycosyltransferase